MNPTDGGRPLRPCEVGVAPYIEGISPQEASVYVYCAFATGRRSSGASFATPRCPFVSNIGH
jgi:hypothetical protein